MQKFWSIKNPSAWFSAFFIFGIFFPIGYNIYSLKKDLEQICELTGSHDVWLAKPFTAKQKIDTICTSHESQDLPNND